MLPQGPTQNPLFLNIVSLSSTISIGTSDKVNPLINTTLHNFGSILSILFLTCTSNLAGFCYCLAEYIVHSQSPCCTSLSALVLLNSVARWCTTTQFFTKMVSFHMLVCMGVGRNLSREASSGFCQMFLYGVAKTTICLCVGKVRATLLKNLGNFKRFKTIPSSELLLNLIQKMKCLTDHFQLCLCFCIGNTE